MDTIKTKLKFLWKVKMFEDATLVIGVVLGLILNKFASAEVVRIYGALFGAMFILTGLFTMSRKCPKCSKYFHGSNAIWGNTLRRSCAHCGLHVNGKNA